MFRKTIFWTHLVSGLIAGIIIAIMSITGVAIAFEEEIIAWADREQTGIEVPVKSAQLSVSELKAIVESERPNIAVTSVVVHQDSALAHQFTGNKGSPFYVNPYTGEIAETKASGTKSTLRTLTNLHRFLGMTSPENRKIGKYITGVSNLAFLLLCVTGLYIWIPRAMKWRLFKNALLLNKKAKGKARDFNWHLVFGVWSSLVLIVIIATAVPISFQWGHKLPFWLNGETPPKSLRASLQAATPAVVPPPPEAAELLSYEKLIESVKTHNPDWVSIKLNFPHSSEAGKVVQAVKVELIQPDYMPIRAKSPLEIDPYTGDILQITTFQDYSPGVRARLWTRFLHTGAAFGFWGKLIASIATAVSLILVYTGFALSWRRFSIGSFFQKKK